MSFTLTISETQFAVCRLEPNQPIPDWATRGRFFSVTRTADELSIICNEADVPDGTSCNRMWKCLKVQGPFAFDVVGVVSELSAIFTARGISLLVVCTYDTDYFFIQSRNFGDAIHALQQAGHAVR